MVPSPQCSPSSCPCVQPALISIKCFDGSYKPLNNFLTLWSKLVGGKKSPYCAGTLGWRGWTLGGKLLAHTDITSCLSRRGYRLIPSHMYQCPAGRLWSWLPTGLLSPQGQIQVKAITSHRLKLLNPLHQGPEMLLAALWPVPWGLKIKNKTPVNHGCGGTSSCMALKQRVIWKYQVSVRPVSVFIPLFPLLCGHFSLSRWCCRATAKRK